MNSSKKIKINSLSLSNKYSLSCNSKNILFNQNANLKLSIKSLNNIRKLSNLDAIKSVEEYYPGIKVLNISGSISYDNLISNTKKEIIKVYNFLDIPYYNKHYYSNLKQININNISYDDSVVGDNMHNIKPLIKKEYNPYIEKIPQRIIKKYGHIKF